MAGEGYNLGLEADDVTPSLRRRVSQRVTQLEDAIAGHRQSLDHSLRRQSDQIYGAHRTSQHAVSAALHLMLDGLRFDDDPAGEAKGQSSDRKSSSRHVI
jgi:hypothetical protein